MKPLTIEQLKALDVGDWVWITALCKEYDTTYVHLIGKRNNYFIANYSRFYNSFFFSDYGTMWLAYKNKEQAEAKGEIVALPCLRDIPDFIDKKGEHTKMKELNYIENGRIYSIPYVDGQFEEAERRLAELKGEKV